MRGHHVDNQGFHYETPGAGLLESVRIGGHGNSTRLRALGGSSTVITRPETSIRELVLGQQNVVCTEPVS